MKLLRYVFLPLLLASVALAETDYVAMPYINDIRNGVDNAHQILVLRVLGDGRIGDDLTVVGDLTVSGTVTLSGISVISNTYNVWYGSNATVVSGGSLSVLGTATLSGISTISGVSTVSNTYSVWYGSNATVISGGRLTVLGTTTMSGISTISNTYNVWYGSNATVVSGGNLSVLGTATISGRSTISNALNKWYGTNLEVVAGGTFTVGAGGSVSLPSGSLALSALALGNGMMIVGDGSGYGSAVWSVPLQNLTNVFYGAATYSNANSVFYGTGMTVVAGGYLTVGAGATITVPSGSIDHSAISGGLVAGLSISPVGLNATQAQVSVRFADPANASVAGAWAFEGWFSTYNVATVADTNGVESFNLTKGSVRRYDFSESNNAEVIGYIFQADADGTFEMTVTSDAGVGTNRFHVLGPNGAYSNCPIVYLGP